MDNLHYLHPFQDKESREDWKANLDFRWFFLDFVAILMALLLAPYYFFGFNLLSLLANGKWPLFVLCTLGPALAVIAFRYYLFEKLPKWARIGIRVIAGAVCAYAYIRMCIAFSA